MNMVAGVKVGKRVSNDSTVYTYTYMYGTYVRTYVTYVRTCVHMYHWYGNHLPVASQVPSEYLLRYCGNIVN